MPVTYCWMFASSFLSKPSPAALPANALYLSASATFSVAFVTIGRNVTDSGARVLPAKKSVTALSPPVRICLPSSTLIAFTALTSSVFACGTAASAARFIAITSSSMRFCWPVYFSTFAASFRKPGSGMRTFGLSRNPPLWPSKATAEAAPRSSAARTPSAASLSVMPAAWADGPLARSHSPVADTTPDVNFRRCMKELP